MYYKCALFRTRGTDPPHLTDSQKKGLAPLVYRVKAQDCGLWDCTDYVIILSHTHTHTHTPSLSSSSSFKSAQAFSVILSGWSLIDVDVERWKGTLSFQVFIIIIFLISISSSFLFFFFLLRGRQGHGMNIDFVSAIVLTVLFLLPPLLSSALLTGF